jgi:hypothetical protein
MSSTLSWHHGTRLTTSSQHEAGTHHHSARLVHHHSMRLAHHHNKRLTHHQHEAGITTLGWHIITTRGWHIINTRLASQHYSPFRGRSLRTTPILSRKCSNLTRDRGLVNTSTTYSFVLTYWSFMAPLCTISMM